MALKFSEAIKLGAMIRPQSFGDLFSVEDGRTCAVGAAAEAVGILDTSKNNSYLEGASAPREWKSLCQARAVCPVCLTDAWDVESCVMHLNDKHMWRRERIADWVEELELQHESIPRVVEAAQQTS